MWRVLDLKRGGRSEAVRALSTAVEKNALNQVVFREVNERIAELSAEWQQTEMVSFVCECSDPMCAESLEITPAEYEQVRADAVRFVIVSGQNLPEVERVVEDNGRFIVVENLGSAATVARDADPRHA